MRASMSHYYYNDENIQYVLPGMRKSRMNSVNILSGDGFQEMVKIAARVVVGFACGKMFITKVDRPRTCPPDTVTEITSKS